MAANNAHRTTVKELVSRYIEEVSALHKGFVQERAKLSAIGRDRIGQLSLAALTPAEAAAYRDRRLATPLVWKTPAGCTIPTPRTLSSATVLRELHLLSAVLEHARKEWGYAVRNVVKDIKVPTTGRARQRRLESGEVERLWAALGECANPWIRPLFIIAIETAARRGELLKLLWSDVDLGRRIALLRDTKNGTDRIIPLSSRAVAVLVGLPRAAYERVFPVTIASLHQAFRSAKRRAGVEGLRWHDLRHEAVSRFFEKGLDVMEAATISGHLDVRMLRRYAHLRAEMLATKIG